MVRKGHSDSSGLGLIPGQQSEQRESWDLGQINCMKCEFWSEYMCDIIPLWLAVNWKGSHYNLTITKYTVLHGFAYQYITV